MNRINDIKEAVDLLLDGMILSSDGKNQILIQNEKVRFHSEKINVLLDIADFIELYKNTTFYIYDEQSSIDENKDIDYYRYYKK